ASCSPAPFLGLLVGAVEELGDLPRHPALLGRRAPWQQLHVARRRRRLLVGALAPPQETEPAPARLLLFERFLRLDRSLRLGRLLRHRLRLRLRLRLALRLSLRLRQRLGLR